MAAASTRARARPRRQVSELLKRWQRIYWRIHRRLCQRGGARRLGLCLIGTGLCLIGAIGEAVGVIVDPVFRLEPRIHLRLGTTYTRACSFSGAGPESGDESAPEAVRDGVSAGARLGKLRFGRLLDETASFCEPEPNPAMRAPHKLPELVFGPNAARRGPDLDDS